jgi:hypothetical protein
VSLQVFRDGRPDKEASRVNNALLAKLQRDDDHGQILEQYLKSKESGDGSYGFMGSISDRNAGVTIPKAMSHMASRAEGVSRVRERMASGEPLKSLFFDEATETELLAEEDVEAYEEGWICPECLQYQTIPSSTCNWRFVGERPSNPDHWGCGYRRDLA